jgi:hypothetical protein
MPKLPLDILNIIAGISLQHYQLMLHIPRFALSTVHNNGNYTTPSQQIYWQHHFTIRSDMTSFYLGVEAYHWSLCGKYHRVQEGPHCGPACDIKDSTQIWFQHDKLHRIQEGPNAGPAVITKNHIISERHLINGPQKHYKDRKANDLFTKRANLHSFWLRGDITWYSSLPSKREEWWYNGELHRINGPAVTCDNGDQYWCQHSKLHRTDGPAIILFNIFINLFAQPVTIHYWYQNNLLHGPTLPNGTLGPACQIQTPCGKILLECWYIHDIIHRENAPALIMSNGHEEWWLNNKPHRPQTGPFAGPAIVTSSGTEFWIHDGKIHREGAPAIIKSDETAVWYENGLKHRINAPAVIRSDGGQEWWYNGMRHRVTGPALVSPDGTSIWYVMDKKVPPFPV